MALERTAALRDGIENLGHAVRKAVAHRIAHIEQRDEHADDRAGEQQDVVAVADECAHHHRLDKQYGMLEHHRRQTRGYPHHQTEQYQEVALPDVVNLPCPDATGQTLHYVIPFFHCRAKIFKLSYRNTLLRVNYVKKGGRARPSPPAQKRDKPTSGVRRSACPIIDEAAAAARQNSDATHSPRLTTRPTTQYISRQRITISTANHAALRLTSPMTVSSSST